MHKLTITQRILIISAVLFVALLVIGGASSLAMRQIFQLASVRLQNDAIPGINSASEISTYALRLHIRALVSGNAHTATERERAVTRYHELQGLLQEAMNRYESTITAAEDRTNFSRLQQEYASYSAICKEYFAAISSGNTAQAQSILFDRLEPANVGLRDHVSSMLKWNQDVASQATREIVDASLRAFIQTLVVLGVGIIAAAAVAFFFIRAINRALHGISSTLEESSSQVASAAGQVSSSSQVLANGASDQAASLEETSSSLEEMASMTKRNAENATSAKKLSTDTRAAAETGNASVEDMRQAMNAIKASSNDIAKIIKTIDEIAFQTNILALNAAVEAARAGEAGAGFAVVAEEVRALAQRSANSAKETAEKIEVAIRNGDQGAAISEQVAQGLAVIVEKARQVDALVGEIATASHEQNQGISQIGKAASQMDKITQSNAGTAEETAAAAEELTAQSLAMTEAVQQLQVLVGGLQSKSAAPHRPAPAPVRAQQPARPTTSKGATGPQRALVTTSATSDAHFLDS